MKYFFLFLKDPDFLVRRGNSGNPISTICPSHQVPMGRHYYLTQTGKGVKLVAWGHKYTILLKKKYF